MLFDEVLWETSTKYGLDPLSVLLYSYGELRNLANTDTDFLVLAGYRNSLQDWDNMWYVYPTKDFANASLVYANPCCDPITGKYMNPNVFEEADLERWINILLTKAH